MTRPLGHQPRSAVAAGPDQPPSAPLEAGAPVHIVPVPDLAYSVGSAAERASRQPIGQARVQGLPDRLRLGIESLSGVDVDDVHVHYDSPQPALLEADAYTRGRDIHLAHGQEHHLPHEAWHVVQQRLGTVLPTAHASGVSVNDNPQLEREATAMGIKALQSRRASAPALDDAAGIGAFRDGELGTQPAASTVAQLHKRDVLATQVTHLVRLNAKGSLHQDDFEANEVAETKVGDRIVVETDNVLASRRGPNQEINAERDRSGEQSNKWVNALTFNKRELPAESYIRSGTFALTDPSADVVAMEPGVVNLLLSYDVPVAGKVYLIDASHRGDMYQERAALAIEKHPLIIFNFKGNNDLTNYLANVPGVDIHLLDYNPAKPKPDDFQPRRVYRSVQVLTESDATDIITGTPGKAFGDLASAMACIPPPMSGLIDAAVDEVFKGIPGDAALIMHRDSGQTGLVYPELDSGGALTQLAEMVRQRNLTPVVCGASEPIKGLLGIGRYWDNLAAIPKQSGIKLPIENPNLYKRDIEAQFMLQAYRKGKFKAVVGFRSGAVDLFTLLGIPTISISLRDIIGEGRHGKFSNDPRWKRTNIQYGIPRNTVTKRVKVRNTEQYMSPYWRARGFDGPSPDEPVGAPGPFHPLDLVTVHTGMDIGVSKIPGQTEKSSGVNSPVTRDDVKFSDLLPDRLRPRGGTEEGEAQRQNEIRRWMEGLKTEISTMEGHDREAALKILADDDAKMERYLKSESVAVTETVKGRSTKKEPKLESAASPSSVQVTKVVELTADESTVLGVLQKLLPGKPTLVDSRDDSAVQAIFGMNAAPFFAAFKLLKGKKLVHSDKQGPYLTRAGETFDIPSPVTKIDM